MEITRLLSKTFLDHIWSSHPERLINVRVLSTSMSDHLPTIVTRKYKGVQQNKTEHTTITYRDIKNLNKEQFIAALKEAPWDSAFIFDDADDVVDAWYDIFQGVVDRFLPLKHKRVKRKSQPNHIVDGFKERYKLLTKAKKSGSDHDWLNYRRAKNYVTNLIRQTKTKLRENKHNSRKLWNLIKCLSGNDGPEHELQQLAEESEIITNKSDIAETLNCFFVDQQKNLTSQIGFNNYSSTGPRPRLPYLRSPGTKLLISFFLSQCTKLQATTE